MLRQLQPETRMQTLLLMQKALHRARQLSHLQHQADAWVAEWSASPPQAYDLATRRTVSSPPAAAAEGFSPETRAAAPTSGAADADGADTNQPTAAAAAPAPAPSPLLRRGPAGAKAGARGAWWDSTVVGELESAVTAFSTHQADLRHVCRLIWVLEAGLAEADHKP